MAATKPSSSRRRRANSRARSKDPKRLRTSPDRPCRSISARSSRLCRRAPCRLPPLPVRSRQPPPHLRPPPRLPLPVLLRLPPHAPRRLRPPLRLPRRPVPPPPVRPISAWCSMSCPMTRWPPAARRSQARISATMTSAAALLTRLAAAIWMKRCASARRTNPPSARPRRMRASSPKLT